MSTTYEKCPKAIYEMADKILKEFATHEPLVKAGVKIDFVFARAELDEKTNKPIGHAVVKKGMWVKGEAKKIGLRDRALGKADCEVMLDGDWWEQAGEDEQRALLDHELHHFAVKIDERGLVLDDLGRPVIQLRYHDFECGFFKVIAERHGMASQERQIAAEVMCNMGQYFWPGLAPLVEKNPKLLTA